MATLGATVGLVSGEPTLLHLQLSELWILHLEHNQEGLGGVRTGREQAQPCRGSAIHIKSNPILFPRVFPVLEAGSICKNFLSVYKYFSSKSFAQTAIPPLITERGLLLENGAAARTAHCSPRSSFAEHVRYWSRQRRGEYRGRAARATQVSKSVLPFFTVLKRPVSGGVRWYLSNP